MPTALIGGALAAGGALISSSSQKSAANQAADTSLKVAQQNNALTRDIYNQNAATLSPFVQTGATAGNYLNAFLGLPTTATTTPAASMGGANYAGYVNANPDLMSEFRRVGGQFGNDPAAYGQFHYNTYGQNEGRAIPGTTNALQPTGPAVTQGDAQNAFSNFLNNSDFAYQSALGRDNVAGTYSGAGAYQSGAALQALQDRQNNINQGYQGNWMNALANQQGVGLSGASALAGVGQNYAGMVTANNNAAGTSAANAALSTSSNPFANALGTIGGGLLSQGIKF